MQTETFNQLVDKYLDETIQPAEKQQLSAFLQDASYAQLLDDLVLQALSNRKFDLEPDESIRQALHQYLDNHTSAADLKPPVGVSEVSIPLDTPPVRRSIPFLQTTWFRYAAVLLLIAGTAIYLYRGKTSQEEIAGIQTNAKAADIAPGGNKAILTLSDGSTIILDNAAVGNLAQQGGAKIIKLNAGSLAYSVNKNNSNELLYNTISTPKGGQYQVRLPDGTQVWLNAASSIRFPTSFSSDARRVEVKGEAYIEVKSHSETPFFVIMDGMEIQVLGTSFNVNAYPEEEIIRTTLLEGSIKIVSDRKLKQQQLPQITLKPGEQAVLTKASGNGSQVFPIQVITGVNTGKVMAWKNGLFDFDGVSMKELMKEVERWYDIKVIYEKGIPDKEFVGKMNRNSSLQTLLKGLEYANVHFRVEGRNIIVLPDTGQRNSISH